MNRYEIQKALNHYNDSQFDAQKFLAAVIYDVWNKRGQSVKVEVYKTPAATSHGSPFYELKSSTLNGRPL